MLFCLETSVKPKHHPNILRERTISANREHKARCAVIKGRFNRKDPAGLTRTLRGFGVRSIQHEHVVCPHKFARQGNKSLFCFFLVIYFVHPHNSILLVHGTKAPTMPYWSSSRVGVALDGPPAKARSMRQGITMEVRTTKPIADCIDDSRSGESRSVA